ncbi:hypothetical protein Q4610_16450 [Sphingobium sp. HBC34]|uniref:STAS/SEC14 domain-containing protein n=1 Tax=Sphingobium cyanobacteriorum TaxID=3063954 RepID=A0ABT8ZQ20_9SPHN|nr:hypothetical protein [Sphingobium sp. HBC34]MDO7836638.1 hypothetical protein [Sphingobium sp. HBC34]
MLDFTFDQVKGRLHIKYTGFWSEAESDEAIAAFKSYTKKLAVSHGAFTLLDDMSGWVPQAPAVVENNVEFGHFCMTLPLVRNAMIICSPLVRRQVLRTVQALECGVYDNFAEADTWLSEVEPVRAT